MLLLIDPEIWLKQLFVEAGWALKAYLKVFQPPTGNDLFTLSKQN
jgi:hypothetical protein